MNMHMLHINHYFEVYKNSETSIKTIKNKSALIGSQTDGGRNLQLQS